MHENNKHSNIKYVDNNYVCVNPIIFDIRGNKVYIIILYSSITMASTTTSRGVGGHINCIHCYCLIFESNGKWTVNSHNNNAVGLRLGIRVFFILKNFIYFGESRRVGVCIGWDICLQLVLTTTRSHVFTYHTCRYIIIYGVGTKYITH